MKFYSTSVSAGVAMTTCLKNIFKGNIPDKSTKKKPRFLYTSKLQMLCKTTNIVAPDILTNDVYEVKANYILPVKYWIR